MSTEVYVYIWNGERGYEVTRSFTLETNDPSGTGRAKIGEWITKAIQVPVVDVEDDRAPVPRDPK